MKTKLIVILTSIAALLLGSIPLASAAMASPGDFEVTFDAPECGEDVGYVTVKALNYSDDVTVVWNDDPALGRGNMNRHIPLGESVTYGPITMPSGDFLRSDLPVGIRPLFNGTAFDVRIQHNCMMSGVPPEHLVLDATMNLGSANYLDIKLNNNESDFWATDQFGIVRAPGSVQGNIKFDAQSRIAGDGITSNNLPRITLDANFNCLECVVGIMPSPSDGGFGLCTDEGRVFPYGDFEFHGDSETAGYRDALVEPIVGCVATPSGGGYYAFAGDGGLFASGDAKFFGSIPQIIPSGSLDQPIVGMTVSPSGNGYLMVAADGGMFAFGDAQFYGSIPQILPGVELEGKIVSMIPQAEGYLLVAEDGGIFNFGTSRYLGNTIDTAFSSAFGFDTVPIAGAAVWSDDRGYIMLSSSGDVFTFGEASRRLDLGWVGQLPF